ncbi:fumarate reductase subunit FrdC [Plesiomonas shigelloides subsp. oncorhynchi]|uniref:Fumarate reductase subunit C n=2 Tax=Plesiomonas shigelloides TaxID=703 RepID=R8ALZ4_PLESH|nr:MULTISPECIES: fumarate reductase subunit FrdC [Plesiomonas]MCX9457658.1 fumarate reductase subunit FrdC [Vibrio cholerae]AVQ87999.1 fumarate reductase subunit FrdC [Plesiomonas shigelloides]EON87366.1 fumarate reductase subunit C [Plesiomonas shigelloides 302-73]KAB7655804.1 fumarate reductase subunit FrdC [Plesiomonas shigelloides]KAB7666231.1 fumarate reductase subunit FrdC [Plesiomonas shigelloides]
MSTISKRKPYVREMKANWWQKLGFYKFYMIREGSAVPTVWFGLVLLYGMFALRGGVDSWYSFVGFLQNPIVLLLNLIALGMTLLHTATWFNLAPKAQMIIINDEKLPESKIVKALWAVMVAFTIFALAIVLI